MDELLAQEELSEDADEKAAIVKQLTAARKQAEKAQAEQDRKQALLSGLAKHQASTQAALEGLHVLRPEATLLVATPELKAAEEALVKLVGTPGSEVGKLFGRINALRHEMDRGQEVRPLTMSLKIGYLMEAQPPAEPADYCRFG